MAQLFWKKAAMVQSKLEKIATNAVKNHNCDYISACKNLGLKTEEIAQVRDMCAVAAEELNIKLRVAGQYKRGGGDYDQYD